MKCPKCSYNSFEFHDVCKKCSLELSGHKATYGLRPIVIPQGAREALASQLTFRQPAPAASFDELDVAGFSWEAPASPTGTGSTVQPENDPDTLFNGNNTIR